MCAPVRECACLFVCETMCARLYVRRLPCTFRLSFHACTRASYACNMHLSTIRHKWHLHTRDARYHVCTHIRVHVCIDIQHRTSKQDADDEVEQASSVRVCVCLHACIDACTYVCMHTCIEIHKWASEQTDGTSNRAASVCLCTQVCMPICIHIITPCRTPHDNTTTYQLEQHKCMSMLA